MASINPFVAPTTGDQPWVDQIRQTLKTQLSVTIDTPPVSIFAVPQNLKDEKLEAYEPQRIGLGPKHHFQTELYQKMEQNKLSAVKRVIKPIQVPDCEDQVVAKVKEIIPVVSACYDSFPQMEVDALAWLFAIDGLFLLDQLAVYSDLGYAIDEKDLIMLENQIPLIVLKEIQKALSSDSSDAEDYWESKFRHFSSLNSPFLLCQQNIDFNRVNHLLDYMYHSIVNNEKSKSIDVNFSKPGSVPDEKPATEELLEAIIQAGALIPGAKPFLGVLESIEKILYDSDEDKTKIQEIKVPSVSELRDIAGVNFVLSPGNEGIRNINFVDQSCYLPFIKLGFDSEVILRNLVAYENLMAQNSFMAGFGLELTEYVDFMCGIIDTASDVKVLREAKIIEGDLSDKEIVALFNGIGRSDGKMSGESELRKTAGELNEVYNSVPSVRFKNEVEKQVRASAKAITFLVSISGTLVLVREAYSKIGSDPSQMLVQFLSQQLGSFSTLIS